MSSRIRRQRPLAEYKLAVQRAPDMVTYIRYDYTQEALTQRQI